MISIRVRSAVWFATGAALMLLVSLLVMDAWSASAAPGDEDSTFVPITTCRLMDTRPPTDRVGLADDWGPGETKVVPATGTNGNCTIPTEAVGLSLNVTAVGATANGFLTFWPDGPLPTSGSSLNPSVGQPPIPNAVSVKLSSAGSFSIYNHAGSVDIVIDINGYHTQESLKEIETRLSALQTAQPFAASDRDAATALGTPGDGDEPIVIVTVTMTPPVAGQITANSVTNVATADVISGAPTPYAPTNCSITTGTVIDDDYTQTFTPEGGNSDARKGQLFGTRTLDVAAGAPVSINLVCRHISGFFTRTDLTDSVLTAIFTPAP